MLHLSPHSSHIFQIELSVFIVLVIFFLWSLVLDGYIFLIFFSE